MTKRLGIPVFLVAAILASLVYSPNSASATFVSNRIMDDAIFDNVNSMTAGQIDNWLNVNFPNSCISTNHGFTAPNPNGYSPSAGFTYGPPVSAGQVIYNAGQAYGVNPQVLLTTLQKEEGLVKGDGPYGCGPLAISASVGYGCPDSGSSYNYSNLSPALYYSNGIPLTSVSNTCVNTASKAGFSQQLIRAAWLLKFGEQRSEGNTGWAVIKGNWDNSDDPATCYGGPMTQGYRKRCSSDANPVYYDGYTVIDGTSTHMDTGPTAAFYWYTPHFHGNQNFVAIFNQWFGDTILPYAFSAPGSNTIYMYVDGFKVSVPAMGILQDYGVSPQSVQTLPQSTIDSIPSPVLANDGISPSLNYIVKSSSDSDADGGSIYLITVGKKYQFKSMQQFNDFGYSQANIAYLPLSFLISFPGTSQLSNFVSSPYGSVFQVIGGQKKLIFDYSTYTSLNPSDILTPSSYFTVNTVPSGAPLSNREILVKRSNGEDVYLFDNNVYYSISTFDIYTCWGFDSALNTPVYRLPDNSYIPTISSTYPLSCFVRNGNSLSLMSRNQKYNVPATFRLTRAQNDTADVISLSNKITTAPAALKQYIKPAQESGVWFLTGGVKKLVPTFANYGLLGLNSSQFDVVDSSVMSSITANGLKLGSGKAVKTDNSAAVYVISGNSRLLYSTSDDFLAYKNDWNDIETYPASTLDADYPYSGTVVGKYYLDSTSSRTYLVDKYGCYYLDSPTVTSYGSPTTNSYVFPRLDLSQCQNASIYVKQNDQPPVYLISNGQKRVFTTWNAFLNYTNQSSPSPNIITLSQSTLATFPNGQAIN
jgi:hypothetical protein